MLLEHTGQLHSLDQIPTAGGPIGRGNTHHKRHVVGNHLADGIHDFDHQAHPVLQRTAVLVLTLIGQRVKEFRKQVAVGCVDFHHIEAGSHSTRRSIAELCDDPVDFINAQLARSIQFRIRDRARGDGLPAALVLRHILMDIS